MAENRIVANMAAEHKGTHFVDADAARVTSIFNKTHEKAVVREDASSDELTLGALGYK